jgi:hypothetical protein
MKHNPSHPTIIQKILKFQAKGQIARRNKSNKKGKEAILLLSLFGD